MSSINSNARRVANLYSGNSQFKIVRCKGYVEGVLRLPCDMKNKEVLDVKKIGVELVFSDNILSSVRYDSSFNSDNIASLGYIMDIQKATWGLGLGFVKLQGCLHLAKFRGNRKYRICEVVLRVPYEG